VVIEIIILAIAEQNFRYLLICLSRYIQQETANDLFDLPALLPSATCLIKQR